MNSSGTWNLALSGAVCGIWLAAACGGTIAPGEPIATRADIIDDDEYESPPVIPDETPTLEPTDEPTLPPGDETLPPGDETLPPGDETLPPGGDDDDTSGLPGMCETRVDVFLATGIPQPDTSLRVALFEDVTLTPDGKPADPSNPYRAGNFNPPLNFPITYTVDLPAGPGFLAEGWIDVNGNTQQDSGDLLAYSPRFDTSSCPATTALTLQTFAP